LGAGRGAAVDKAYTDVTNTVPGETNENDNYVVRQLSDLWPLDIGFSPDSRLVPGSPMAGGKLGTGPVLELLFVNVID